VIYLRNELLAMSIDMAVFALQNNISVLPTGKTPIELLNEIAEYLRSVETPPVVKRGRRKKTADLAAVG
jgi:hypothetical protein